MQRLRIVFAEIQKTGQGHHDKRGWYMLNISFDISDNQEMIGWNPGAIQAYYFTGWYIKR
jgi:hypothetical protein